jgi:FixJ family two-component response regulator
MSTVKRIYLIDDDESFLRSLTRLLKLSGFEVLPFSSPVGFLPSVGPGMSGCIITDLKMPGMSGHELLAALDARACHLPVIFLTGHGGIPDSVLAMKRGAVNFLTKPVAKKDLIAAVDEAFAVHEAHSREDAELAELLGRYASLTPREKEVYEKVTQGLLNKQAAADLEIAEKTIKVHRARVMEKMKANSVADLVRMFDRVKSVLPGPV